jgi:5'-methylthioadenosine phosphorylase
VGDRLGLVVGSSLVGGALALDAREVVIDTAWGPVPALDSGAIVVVDRHHATPDGFRPPHRLDDHRTIAALCAAGCDRVLALSSVGGLQRQSVGTLLVPDDFLAPTAFPTYFDDARGHRVPGFDAAWRSTVLETWRAVTTTAVVDGGVYAQTPGPRFETPAEVRVLAASADVVGMTVATECILAGEAGLAYAAVCVVDNLANGLDDQPLSVEAYRAAVDANRTVLLADLARVLPALTAPPHLSGIVAP